MRINKMSLDLATKKMSEGAVGVGKDSHRDYHSRGSQVSARWNEFLVDGMGGKKFKIQNDFVGTLFD